MEPVMEEMDRFKTAWLRELEGASVDAATGAALGSVIRRAQTVRRTVAWRDGLETGLATAGVIFFAILFFTFPGSLAKVGCAVIIGGLVLIIIRLRLARGPLAASGRELTVREFCMSELESVDAQIRLLKSVAWWYLGPVTLGVNLFFFGVRGLAWQSFCYLGATLVLAAFIYWLNQKAVRRRLVPIHDRLRTVLDQLEASDEPRRRGR
jgi:hypothetical protein